MPTKIECSCGYVFKEWDELPTNDGFYHEIYYRLDGQCPACGRRMVHPDTFFRKYKLNVIPA